MKQKDIVLVIVIVFISGVLSIVISNKLFASPKNRQEKVEIVDPITAEFQTPDKKYFNESSIDPTQLIKIGDGNSNTDPFPQEQN
jgi:hypothetical protein